MKPDLYTKIVLSVIAVMLVVIGCKPTINPQTAVKAEGQFAGVQLSATPALLIFFDSRTGEIHEYNQPSPDSSVGGKLYSKGRLTKLGEPLAKE